MEAKRDVKSNWFIAGVEKDLQAEIDEKQQRVTKLLGWEFKLEGLLNEIQSERSETSKSLAKSSNELSCFLKKSTSTSG